MTTPNQEALIVIYDCLKEIRNNTESANRAIRELTKELKHARQ